MHPCLCCCMMLAGLLHTHMHCDFAMAGLSSEHALTWQHALQAEFPSGARVYAEQISHHPPISSWEVVDEDGQVGCAHNSHQFAWPSRRWLRQPIMQHTPSFPKRKAACIFWQPHT